MVFVEELQPFQRPRLSHGIRKMQRSGTVPEITTELFKAFVADPLPSPRRQTDNFLIWAGDRLRQSDPAGSLSLITPVFDELAATIGSFSTNSAAQLLRDLNDDGLFHYDEAGGNRPSVRLLARGWDRYEELKKSAADSRIAFMAMPFNNRKLDRVFNECLKPAVAETGFELRVLTEKQPAGLIDDALRVAIRRARFLVSELTGNNPGAYWEAGFAEGLGKPVIYTCDKSVFDDPNRRPHFDTNHCLTVLWEEKNLQLASERLKNTIRATLPDEAKMADD